MNRMTRLLCTLIALLAVGVMLSQENQPATASSDTTVVTIDPKMPDDFLNLYPELDGDELAELPSTGLSRASFAQIGLLVVGVVAVAVAVAMTLGRRRETTD